MTERTDVIGSAGSEASGELFPGTYRLAESLGWFAIMASAVCQEDGSGINYVR
jgi:hypothetical protein